MSKGLMKRPTPNFVVEVRRQRRSTNESPKSWLEEPRFARAAASAGDFPSAAELFEPELKAPIVEAPPPQRRILQSLVETVVPPPEEPAAPTRRARERTASEPAPRMRVKAERPATEPAPPIQAALVEAPLPPRRAKPAARKAAEPKKAPPLLVAAIEPAVTVRPLEKPDASPADARAGQRQTRHRRILERYVLGGELKPGEGWKRRQQLRRD
jgi:hypothetical protein